MGKCGCSSNCSCAISAGTGITVTGVGSQANPYVISAGAPGLQVTDTPTVDLTLTGSGTILDPHIITAAAKISAVAGNILTAQADGLAVTCESVQDCVGAGFAQGLLYDDAANAFTARIDPAAGNAITQSAAGLFATSGTTTTVADTNSVNLTQTPGGLITADVIRDPAVDNILTIGPAGVLVSCEAVQDCVGAGFAQGLIYNDALNTFTARIDPAPGNAIAQTAAGLFVAAGGGATVVTADTPCIAVNGDGSGGSPVTAVPILDPAAGNLLTCGPAGMAVSCESVQDCVGAGFTQGLIYNDALNTFTARIDPVAGNTITQSAAGLLVPATVATVTTGPCGVSGTGAPGSPIVAKVAAWPFACPQSANATNIFCDPVTGQLQGEPRGKIVFDQQFINTTPAATAVPGGTGTGTIVGPPLSLNVPNPSTCLAAISIVELEVDADFDLPVGAAAELMIDADVMWRDQNRGTAAQNDIHTQATKVVMGGAVAAGGSLLVANELRMRGGAGGATYDRTQLTGRAWVIAL